MGNPNKKSKLRKIIVNDEEYFWNVHSPNCDGDDHCALTIWKNKKRIYDDVYKGDNIGPAGIKDIIIKL